MVLERAQGSAAQTQAQRSVKPETITIDGLNTALAAGTAVGTAAGSTLREIALSEQQSKSAAVQQKQKLDPRVQQAIDRIIRFDPSLKPIIEKLLREGRLEIMVASNSEFQATAREFMGPSFKGDAFTASAAVVKPNGQIRTTQHVIMLSEDALKNGGKAFVAIAHELYHCKRALEGTATPSDNRREERETYTASIKAAQAAVQKIEESARESKDAAAKQRLTKLAQEIRQQLVIDRASLQKLK